MRIYKINPFKIKNNKYVNTIETDGYLFNYYFIFFTNYKWININFYKTDDFFLENKTQFYTFNKNNNNYNYSYYKFLIIKYFFQFILNKIINKIKNI
jgi:hypothetical protein